MNNRNADLFVILALAAIGMLVALAGMPTGFPRLIITLPLALLLPGYVLSMALFPHRLAMDVVERVATVISLSLVTSVIGGIVLHLTPWGLQATTWAIWLGLVTWVGSLAFLARRHKLPSAEAPVIRWPRFRQWLPLGLAIVLGAIALGIAVDGSEEPRSEPFTQLWLLPDAMDSTPSVQLGLRNMEGVETSYHLVLHANDVILGEWRDLALAPGEAAGSVIPLPDLSDALEIRAELFLAEEPDILYRRAHLRSLTME